MTTILLTVSKAIFLHIVMQNTGQLADLTHLFDTALGAGGSIYGVLWQQRIAFDGAATGGLIYWGNGHVYRGQHTNMILEPHSSTRPRLC